MSIIYSIGSTKNETRKSLELLHLKLINQALKTFPNSKKQKEITKEINIVRKKLGIEPLQR
jgi:hypothetical protein